MMMLNYTKSIICLTFIGLFIPSCITPPKYPDNPRIDLITVNKTSINAVQDSIFIKLKFKDGDGDLGMNESDQPNKQYTVAYNSRGDTIMKQPDEPYDCEIFETVGRETFRVNRNKNYYNFFLTYFQKQPNGSYTELKCINNNGRFSRFEPNPDYSGPLEGEIAYGFKGLFSNDPNFKGKTVKMNIYIQDRAGHPSNVITTEDVTF